MTPDFKMTNSFRNEAIEDKIKALLEEQKAENAHYNAAMHAYKSIETALLVNHLKITDAHYRGNHIDIKAESDGKFKFILDRGYAPNGSGRNQKVLNEKAGKIMESVRFLTGFRCDVNCFSLEIKKAGDTKRVLIDIYLPTL